MKRILLSFQSERIAPLQWLGGARQGAASWCGLALLFAWLTVTAAIAWQSAQVRQELGAAQRELRALDRRRANAAPTDALTVEQRRAWNQVIRQLNIPWGMLLAGLEAATPQDVSLVAMEMDARQAGVRLLAEAKTLDVLLSYAQTLRNSPPFDEVTLVKHETNEQDPSRPLRLTLNVRLRDNKAGGPSRVGAAP